MINLEDVPRCIDPTCLAIEIKAGSGGFEAFVRTPDKRAIEASRSDLRWRQIPRLEIYPQDFLPPNDCIHVFGLIIGEELRFGVGYDKTGMLKYLIIKHRGAWEASEIPQEITGRIATRPSMRVLFETDDQRDEFIRFVSELHRKDRVPGMLRLFACPVTVEKDCLPGSGFGPKT